MRSTLAGLLYFIAGAAAVESLAGRAGFGFWTWFLALCVVGIAAFSLICGRYFAFQAKQTAVAAIMGVAALCLLGAMRGWFLFANRLEIVSIGAMGVALAALTAWGCSKACAVPR